MLVPIWKGEEISRFVNSNMKPAKVLCLLLARADNCEAASQRFSWDRERSAGDTPSHQQRAELHPVLK